MALNLVTCNLISFSDVPEENRNCFEVSASMESRAEPEDFVLVSSFWPLLGFFFAQDIVGAVAKNTRNQQCICFRRDGVVVGRNLYWTRGG
jgi:hypothetical protein